MLSTEVSAPPFRIAPQCSRLPPRSIKNQLTPAFILAGLRDFLKYLSSYVASGSRLRLPRGFSISSKGQETRRISPFIFHTIWRAFSLFSPLPYLPTQEKLRKMHNFKMKKKVKFFYFFASRGALNFQKPFFFILKFF